MRESWQQCLCGLAGCWAEEQLWVTVKQRVFGQARCRPPVCQMFVKLQLQALHNKLLNLPLVPLLLLQLCTSLLSLQKQQWGRKSMATTACSAFPSYWDKV